MSFHEKIDLDLIIGCPGFEGTLGQQMPGDHHYRTFFSNHVASPDPRPSLIRLLSGQESVLDNFETLAAEAHGESSVTSEDLATFALHHGLRGHGDDIVIDAYDEY